MYRALMFAALVFLAGIVSVLIHELGHCLFYWLQGVPAAMSFVKEFPLRNITASEYAVGSAGGPFANVVLVGLSIWLYKKYQNRDTLRTIFSAFILANVFYFVLRGLIALLKRRGGELGDVAGLIGLGYVPVVVLFGTISVGALYYWMKLGGIRFSLRTVGSFVALLVGYVIVMVGMESIDSKLFWHRFPTIQIDDGRTYNEPIVRDHSG